jgi:hypothetical protein
LKKTPKEQETESIRHERAPAPLFCYINFIRRSKIFISGNLCFARAVVRQNNNYIERRQREREREKKGANNFVSALQFRFIAAGAHFLERLNIHNFTFYRRAAGAAAECTLFTASYCQAFCVTEKFLKLLRRAETKGKYTVLLLISKTKTTSGRFLQTFLDSVDTVMRYCKIFWLKDYEQYAITENQSSFYELSINRRRSQNPIRKILSKRIVLFLIAIYMRSRQTL